VKREVYAADDGLRAPERAHPKGKNTHDGRLPRGNADEIHGWDFCRGSLDHVPPP